MDNKDIILLEYLAEFDKPIKISEDIAPHDIQANFQFYGIDKAKNPDSLFVRLFELSKFKLVNEPYVNMWQITSIGRTELQNHLKYKHKNMVSEEILLKYFFKQNKELTIDDLMTKFQTNDSILNSINYLVDNDWLEEVDALNWQISKDGKEEYERRLMITNPQRDLLKGKDNDFHQSSFQIVSTVKNMKIFLSWSGDRSKNIALALNDFLLNLFQGIQIFMSEYDISAGSRWGIKLINELEKSQFGIICLTPENLNAAWLLFEAGAISKAVEDSYVVPYLFKMELNMVPSPLVQFQSVLASEQGTFKLVKSINKIREHQLTSEQLNKAFAKWWPDLKNYLTLVKPFQEIYGISISSLSNDSEINWTEIVHGTFKHLPDTLRIRIYTVDESQSKCWLNTQKVDINRPKGTWKAKTYFGSENESLKTFFLVVAIDTIDSDLWVNYITEFSSYKQHWPPFDYPLPENIIECQKIQVQRK